MNNCGIEGFIIDKLLNGMSMYEAYLDEMDRCMEFRDVPEKSMRFRRRAASAAHNTYKNGEKNHRKSRYEIKSQRLETRKDRRVCKNYDKEVAVGFADSYEIDDEALVECAIAHLKMIAPENFENYHGTALSGRYFNYSGGVMAVGYNDEEELDNHLGFHSFEHYTAYELIDMGFAVSK